MKHGLTLEQMAAEVQRQSRLKQDYVIDTRELTMLNGSELAMPTGASTGPAQATGGSYQEYGVSQIAHRQIGERLSIPAKFYDRLRQPDVLESEANMDLRRLLDTNVNTLFRQAPERRMIRTFDSEDGGLGLVRAFLSDRYRRRDNDELAEHILPILGEIPDVRIESTALTDTRFYLKAIAPRIEREVAKGDIVQAGVMIRNSEVGHGSLTVQPIVYRLICLNGMIVAQATRHYHVGRQVDSDEANRVFRDETLALDDAAFFSKLADVVKAAVDEAQFEQIVMQMRDARDGQRIEKPVEAMERLTKRFTFSDDEGESVLKHLIEGGDLSAYGVLNAITRASQDVESYDRATELEAVGGQVLAIAGTREWEAICAG